MRRLLAVGGGRGIAKNAGTTVKKSEERRDGGVRKGGREGRMPSKTVPGFKAERRGAEAWSTIEGRARLETGQRAVSGVVRGAIRSRYTRRHLRNGVLVVPYKGVRTRRRIGHDDYVPRAYPRRATIPT